MREAALEAALDEMVAWLETPSSQVAIFDATNSTEARRQTLVRAAVSPATSICLQSGFCSGPGRSPVPTQQQVNAISPLAARCSIEDAAHSPATVF